MMFLSSCVFSCLMSVAESEYLVPFIFGLSLATSVPFGYDWAAILGALLGVGAAFGSLFFLHFGAFPTSTPPLWAFLREGDGLRVALFALLFASLLQLLLYLRGCARFRRQFAFSQAFLGLSQFALALCALAYDLGIPACAYAVPRAWLAGLVPFAPFFALAALSTQAFSPGAGAGFARAYAHVLALLAWALVLLARACLARRDGGGGAPLLWALTFEVGPWHAGFLALGAAAALRQALLAARGALELAHEQRLAWHRTFPARGETKHVRRCCVIGSGPAGLVTAKSLLEEGHEVVVLEGGDRVAGVFARCYEGCLLTTSTMMTPFSDFHPDGLEDPVFWTAHEYADYLQDYADHFGVTARVQFGTRVLRVTKAGAGGMDLRVTRSGGAEETLHFDKVVVCTGTNAVQSRPHYPGEEDFCGEILHSGDFRQGEDLAGKRVLLVGAGESGSDISLLVARHAEQVCVSVRNFTGGWIIPRIIFGWPFDLDSTWVHHALPNWFIYYHDVYLMYLILVYAHLTFNHDWKLWARWILQKRVHTMQTFGVKNLSLATAVNEYGAVLKQSDVERFTADGVVFKDGSTFECNAVVLCTGFKNSFDFLGDVDVAKWNRTDEKYLHCIDPDYGTDLAVNGFVRSHFAAVPPVAEMIGRYLAGLYSGRYELPSMDVMQRDIAEHRARRAATFGEATASRITSLVEYLPMMEKLAGILGVNPDFRYVMLTDPWLYVNLLIAPMVTSRYRLMGPHSNYTEARRHCVAYPISWQAYMHAAVMLLLSILHWMGVPVGMKKPFYS